MPDDDLSNFVVEDEAETEFHSILHRTRLIKQLEEKAALKQFSAEADKVSLTILGSTIIWLLIIIYTLFILLDCRYGQRTKSERRTTRR